MVNLSLIRDSYPFTSRYYQLESNQCLHYIDEGVGPEVLLCVHGNPTWSYYFREVVVTFKEKFRVIVPDHLGCGVSDKPQDYSYTLANHIENLDLLLGHLKVEKVHLMVHDWGGAIGFGWALKNIDKLASVVITNTAAFYHAPIPWRILACKIPFIGRYLVQSANLFALAATKMAVVKKLSAKVRDGLLLPYGTYKERVAIAGFIQDIPLSKLHRSAKLLLDIERNLGRLDSVPKQIIWGAQDFCFNQKILETWRKIYPQAPVQLLPEAGHYLLEDEPEKVLTTMQEFYGS